jgi:hypothetical protein
VERAVHRFAVARWSMIFEPADEETPDPADLAVPMIDDRPLFEICGDRYPGLFIATVAPPSRHWLGEPTYTEDPDDRIGDDDGPLRPVVLDGECGIADCCGVFARIDIGDEVVTWSDFFANGRPPLPDGLHFTFDRDQYEHAIAHVIDGEPTRFIVRDEVDG